MTAETNDQGSAADTVPRRWWDSLRSEMDAVVLSGVTANEFTLGAKGYRDVKAREKHARYTLARMNELERGMTLDAALDEQEAAGGGAVAMSTPGRADVDR